MKAIPMLPFFSGNLPVDRLMVPAAFVASSHEVESDRLSPNVSVAKLIKPEKPGSAVFLSDPLIAVPDLQEMRCLYIAGCKVGSASTSDGAGGVVVILSGDNSTIVNLREAMTGAQLNLQTRIEEVTRNNSEDRGNSLSANSSDTRQSIRSFPRLKALSVIGARFLSSRLARGETHRGSGLEQAVACRLLRTITPGEKSSLHSRCGGIILQ
ncbi:hypothetical protein M3484_06250 [Pseudomonas sp. GX19020]|uniref:hypothetical protein n=1 Tax=Pseudomonas sp. GX19020 TaxID=2942277 RepID=UPI002019EA79|nr:hypothetical protein [Pseudomonas sp. GX19020]MCL4066164.1 hypothetical protein [Pseudomonas sp. GX19020]